MTSLNWKNRADGSYDALASRLVGGKYVIRWIERHYSEDWCEWFEVRSYDVHYRTKGGGATSNVSLVRLPTLAQAKAVAELDHAKMRALISKYGSDRDIPWEEWDRFKREMRAWQEEHCAPRAA